ncbi:hypothetical protein GLOTRDRAFT_132843 [Gloeophyllum trabeum ATCC 11539]|uniref:F-box domain-containing protein n=1 Tax=Gloeophyllum trabeum (strain ATCC 11539 / FP-39264 / Madison 617) TaxID=670483 RepID=S7RB82_GLOTA|nr:uncharacterized protein GLOTRDRAFT_132843 [Gloeophyllum trabeum ATCC 11539]EPQ51475.1 hypothetical protein GLOTRDRAFT_132843 [Gloeophyllum trabeum ATCC 11539]
MNYDVLLDIMTFLPPQDLRRLAVTSKVLHEPSSLSMVEQVELYRPSQVQSFHSFVIQDPTRLSLMRSLKFSPNAKSLLDDDAHGWSTGTDEIRSSGPLLADILERAPHLRVLELWYTDILFCIPRLRQAIKNNCPKLLTLKISQFNTWKMSPRDIQDLRPLFDSLKHRVTRLEVKSIFERPVQEVLRTLDSRLETLAVALVSGDPSILRNGSMFPHVKNLSISGYRLLREDISRVFPNVRQLEICEDFLINESLCDSLQETTEWAALETLSGDLRDVARIGLTRRVKHLNLDTYAFHSASVPAELTLSFFSTTRPRSLSLTIHSDKPKILAILMKPILWDSLSELSYMNLIIKDLTEWAGAVHRCLVNMYDRESQKSERRIFTRFHLPAGTESTV